MREDWGEWYFQSITHYKKENIKRKKDKDMEVDSITRARQHLDSAEAALRDLDRVIEDMEETVRKMEELRDSLKRKGVIR